MVTIKAPLFGNPGHTEIAIDTLRKAVSTMRRWAVCAAPDDVGHAFLSELAGCVKAAGGSLFLKEPDRMVLAGVLDPGHSPDALPLPLKAGSVMDVVLKSAAPLRIEDASSDPRIAPCGASAYDNGSFLALPLMDDNRTVRGVVSLHNKTSPPFTWHDEWVGLALSTIWDGLAETGIQGKTTPPPDAPLPETAENQRTREELCKRESELALINEISRSLNSSLDLDQVLGGILHSVRRFLKVTGSSVWLIDSETGELVCRQAAGLYSSLVKGWRLPPGEGIAGRVIRQGRTMNIRDTQNEPDHFKLVDQQTGLEMRSILCVPLSGKKGVIGVIEVVDVEPGRFDAANMRIMEALSATATAAIENARLFARAQREISMRKEKEQDLRESEEKYRTILETMEEGYFETDIDGNFLFFNESFRKILGRPAREVLGENYRKFASPSNRVDTKAIIAKVLDNGRWEKIPDWQILRKDGSKRDIEYSVIPKKDPEDRNVGFRGIAHDVTGHKASESTRKDLEYQLQQSQKMEAIGTLAGGIAHDFNNILTSILGFAELAKMKLSEGGNILADLDEIITGGKRAGELVKRILAFSRQDRDEFSPVCVHTIVDEVLELLRPSLPSTISIEKRVEVSGPVLADGTQIHQVVMNLCTNAYHAMHEKGGVLEIGLKEVSLCGNDNTQTLHLDPGRYVRLVVRDTGHGMDRSVQDRMFEPYFTTKEKGKGTGLGLSMVHGIVRNHGGGVQVLSEPMAGTRFFIFLPVVQQTVPSDIQNAVLPPKGSEKILMVDDEPTIVKLCRQMLERQGYEVETRTSSLEALELFRTKPHRFDMVITDMTMPGMTGDRLAVEMMRIRPDIPVLLCTGYSEQISEKQAMEMGICAFAMKPLVMKELNRTIRNVLDREK